MRKVSAYSANEWCISISQIGRWCQGSSALSQKLPCDRCCEALIVPLVFVRFVLPDDLQVTLECNCTAFNDVQHRGSSEDQPPEDPGYSIISREVGAGGRTIAELLSQRLAAAEKTPVTSPWAVFDANLAKQVLEDHQLPLI